MNLFIISNNLNTFFIFDMVGKMIKKIKMQLDFSYFEPTKNGIFVFYDNLKFTKYKIDPQNYQLENT